MSKPSKEAIETAAELHAGWLQLNRDHEMTARRIDEFVAASVALELRPWLEAARAHGWYHHHVAGTACNDAICVLVAAHDAKAGR